MFQQPHVIPAQHPHAHSYNGGLAYSYAHLQQRARRAPIQTGMGGVSRPQAMAQQAGKTPNVEDIKNFYLKRLQQSKESSSYRPASAGMSVRPPMSSASVVSTSVGSTSTSTASSSRPKFTADMLHTAKDVDVMCTLCFTLVKSSEVAEHSRKCQGLVTPANPVEELDIKLKKWRVALETRLCADQSNQHILRTWTNLKYHLDAALKWTVGCAEIGAVSDHTSREVKMLTSTARHLAPAMYVFSMRIENIISLKIKALKDAAAGKNQTGASDSQHPTPLLAVDRPDDRDHLEVQSVAEMDSDCGTMVAETAITQSDVGGDIANVAEASLMQKSMESKRNEEDERRWFYSMCLNYKMACQDKEKSRKILIADLYHKFVDAKVPTDERENWIKQQIDNPDGADTPSALPPQASQPQAPPAQPNVQALSRWEQVKATTHAKNAHLAQHVSQSSLSMSQPNLPSTHQQPMDDRQRYAHQQREMQQRLQAGHSASEQQRLQHSREENARGLLSRSHHSPSLMSQPQPYQPANYGMQAGRVVGQQMPAPRGHLAPFQQAPPNPYANQQQAQMGPHGHQIHMRPYPGYRYQ